MSPFKKKRSPYWYIRPVVVIPGEGKRRLNEMSTRTRDKATAAAMHALIQQLPILGYGDLLQMLRARQTSVQEIYAAHLGNRLDAIRQRATDPELEDVVKRVAATVSDDRVRAGLSCLPALASQLQPGTVRLSFLQDPRHVRELLLLREREGVRRNTVRRTLYRAISDLLSFQLGPGEKAKVMNQVHYPTEDDEREIFLTVEQISELLDGCVEDRFRAAVELAVTTGIDRGPILRLEGRHYLEAEGQLIVPDTKTRARRRTLQLPERARAALRTAMMLGAVGPKDRIFPWTFGQFRDRWEAAREAAGLEHVRFKDLRGVFATYFLRAGGSPKQLQEVLGHSNLTTTLRYVKRLPLEQGREMDAAVEELGLGRHLKLEKGA